MNYQRLNDQHLRELIRQADAMPPPPATTARELACRVRVLCRRRRGRHLAVAIAAIVAIGGLLWHGSANRRRGEPPGPVAGQVGTPPVEVAHADEHLRLLLEQIDREEQAVGRLLAAERLRRLSHARQQAGVVLDRQAFLDEQAGRAAMCVLLTGDRRAKQAESLPAARQDYASVIELFPNTPWAEQAKQRLAALNPK
ncbi:MAG: hypothetical protein ABSF26_21970 [Thermoguttaceae bacterium]|jgi:hypothetical protein